MRFFKSLRNIQMETFLLYCRHREVELIFFIDLQLPGLCSGEAQANCTHPSSLFLMHPSEMRFQLSWFEWGRSQCRVWCPVFWVKIKHRWTFWSWSATLSVGIWWPVFDLLSFPQFSLLEVLLGTDFIFLYFHSWIFANIWIPNV